MKSVQLRLRRSVRTWYELVMTVMASSSHCARHADAPAAQVCPRCGDWVCMACWSAQHSLCDLCAKRDRLYHVQPLPWEQPELSLPRRVFGTVWALVRPWSCAAAVARGSVAQAAQFAMVVTLPLACLSTLIPLTRTLLFAPPFSIRLLGAPSARDIAVDVLRALALGPLLTLLMLMPVFAGTIMGSLFRTPKVWLRDALYWSWLQPLLMLVTYVPVWISTQAAWASFVWWPLLLLWWISRWFIARRAALVSWPVTILTVFFAGVASLVGLGMSSGLLRWLAPAAIP